MTTTLDVIRSQLTDILNILENRIGKLTVAPNQIVTLEGLSDIDNRLGIIQAGEFRSGNGKLPGDGFTGGRFGFPGFLYGTDTYFLAGVDDDVLQVGLSLTNGKIFAGAGSVVIDVLGIAIKATGLLFTSNGYKFVDVDDPTQILGGVYSIVRHGAFDDFFVELRAQATDATLLTATASVDGVASTTAIARLTADSGAFAGAASMAILKQIAGGGIFYVQDAAALFNSTSEDLDFTINGNTVQVFKVDAGFDRVEIGLDHYFATRSSTNVNTYINEANQDMDTFIRSVNDDNMFVVDAGLDAIGIAGAAESGYKLKVSGKINLSTGNTYDINGSAHQHTSSDALFAYGNLATVPASSTRYLIFGATGVFAGSSSTPPNSGTWKNLRLTIESAQPGTGSLVVTVKVGGVSTGLTITIAAGSGVAVYSDLTHTYAYSAGSYTQIEIVNNATAASAQIGACTMESVQTTV